MKKKKNARASKAKKLTIAAVDWYSLYGPKALLDVGKGVGHRSRVRGEGLDLVPHFRLEVGNALPNRLLLGPICPIHCISCRLLPNRVHSFAYV